MSTQQGRGSSGTQTPLCLSPRMAMMIFCLWVKGIRCSRKVILISFFVERNFLLKGRLAKSQSNDANAQSSEPQGEVAGLQWQLCTDLCKEGWFVSKWDWAIASEWSAPIFAKGLAAAWRNQMGSETPVTRT